MLFLYKTLIRPFLEYGTIITCPHKKKMISKIESVQNSFTRKLMFRQAGKIVTRSDPLYKSASDRLAIFNIESLEKRRKILDLKFVTKMMQGKVNISTNRYFQCLSETRTRRRHRFRWKTPRSSLRFNFFTHRVLSNYSPFTSTTIP